MSWCIALPHIGPPGNLEEFVMGIKPEYWPEFVVTDNSEHSDCWALGLDRMGASLTCRPFPNDDPVAAAWNRGLKRGCDVTFIMSVSMRFPNGLLDAIGRMLSTADEVGVRAVRLGWHFKGFTRKTVERVGYFDENFRPAYFEDSDYAYRMKLAGITHWPWCDSGAICAGESMAYKAGYARDWSRQREYYLAKWGGLPDGSEQYTRPFNDPTKPISWWEGCP